MSLDDDYPELDIGDVVETNEGTGVVYHCAFDRRTYAVSIYGKLSTSEPFRREAMTLLAPGPSHAYRNDKQPTDYARNPGKFAPEETWWQQIWSAIKMVTGMGR